MFDDKHVDGPFLKPVHAPTRTQTRTRIIWGRFVPHLKRELYFVRTSRKKSFQENAIHITL